MASPFCVCSTHREAPLESFFPFLASRKEGSQAYFDKPRNRLAIFLGVPRTAEFLSWQRAWAVEPCNLLALSGGEEAPSGAHCIRVPTRLRRMGIGEGRDRGVQRGDRQKEIHGDKPQGWRWINFLSIPTPPAS